MHTYKMTPVSNYALGIVSAATIGASIASGSYNCWPCLLGTIAAGVVVWLSWFGLWRLNQLPTGKFTVFDKVLLSVTAPLVALVAGMFLIAVLNMN